jgi:DNA polymerase III epsilon subunit-like protein
MKFLGLDLEATDKEPTTARITELGIMKFEILDTPPDEGTGFGIQILVKGGSLVYESDYPPQSEEVLRVTGISDEDLISKGKSFRDALLSMDSAVGDDFDYIVCHNKGYDEVLFKAELERHKDKFTPEFVAKWVGKPWICTLRDVEYPDHQKCKKLSHLALDHGVPIDPATLHRSVGDVNLMLLLLEYGQYDLRQVIERMKIPDIYIRAVVPSPFGRNGDGGAGKDHAKACGYGWQTAPGTDKPVFDLCWVKKIKEDRFDAEKLRLGDKYEVKKIEV